MSHPAWIYKAQTNILKGHGKKYTRIYGVKFKFDTKKGRFFGLEWLTLIKNKISFAGKQNSLPGCGSDEGYNLNFGLTSAGLKRLTYPNNLIPIPSDFLDPEVINYVYSNEVAYTTGDTGHLLYENLDGCLLLSVNEISEFDAAVLEIDSYSKSAENLQSTFGQAEYQEAIIPPKELLKDLSTKDSDSTKKVGEDILKKEYVFRGPLGFIDGKSNEKNSVQPFIKTAGDFAFCAYQNIVVYDIKPGKFQLTCQQIANRKIFDHIKNKDFLSNEIGERLMGSRKANGQRFKRSTAELEATISSNCPFSDHISITRGDRLDNDQPKILRRSLLPTKNGKQVAGLVFISYTKSLKEHFMPIVKRMGRHQDFIVYIPKAPINQKVHPVGLIMEINGEVSTLKIFSSQLKFISYQGDQRLFVPSRHYLDIITS